MTRASANLLALRSLLLTHLDNAPGSDDLDADEVGIVGDPAHRGGYHCGSDRVVTNDYSVVESPRDRAGLTLDAAALDVGQFEVRSGGRTHTLPSFSLWCVGECQRNAADTRDIREIIYSPDGHTVKRFDRLGRRSTGDSSHRWHTHFSFFRDAIKAGRDQRPLFRRYLSSIGLLEDDDMTPEEHTALFEVREQFRRFFSGMRETATGTVLSPTEWRIRDEQKFQPAVTAGLARVEASVTALAAASGVDQATLADIRARVDQAAAEDRQRADAEAARDAELAELVRAGTSGELDASEVVRLIGEKLAGGTTPQS